MFPQVLDTNASASLRLLGPIADVRRGSRGRARAALSGSGFLLIVLWALMAKAGVAVAGECIEYTDYIHRLPNDGIYGNDIYGDDIVVVGTRAYAARGGLKVWDISNPASPVVVGSVGTGGHAQGVALAGSYAYVADAASGLTVIDISEPANPVIVGSVDTPGMATRIAVAGSYAYVADEESGLQVVDITDPTSPVIVGTVDTPGRAVALALSGSYAYVADWDSGLQVVDISDPTSPVIVGSVMNFSTVDIAVAGSYAYLTSPESLTVVDISDPTSPAVIGTNEGHEDYGLAVAGPYAVVFSLLGYDSFFQIRVVDISNPASPVTIGRVDAPGHSYSCCPRQPVGIAVAGSYVYVEGEIFDISNPYPPPIVGSVDTPGQAQDVAVAGSYAYVADAASGLTVIDISDPASPAIVGSVDTPGEALGVSVAGSYAYVADWNSGLQVIDISDPAHPAIAGSVDTPEYGGNDVAVAGSYAYVAGEASGLTVIDISDPTSPAIVGSVDTPEDAHEVVVAGSYAYVADSRGLYVIDISDPASPTIRGSLKTNAYSVDVAGSYALVGGHTGLMVVDISDPASPAIVGGAGIADDGVGVAVSESGSHAYVTVLFSGLEVFDITDPAHPRSVGGIFGGVGGGGDVAMAGSHIFLTYGDLDIVSAQCEAPTPVLGSELSATRQGEGVLIRWRAESGHFVSFDVLRAPSADAAPGVYERLGQGQSTRETGVWQYRDETAPAGYAYAYLVEGHFPDGGTLSFGPIVADGSPGFGFALLPVRPLPARETATVPFSLPYRAKVRLEIYDATGRTVRTLVDEIRSAGQHLVAWDGRDDAARRMASGVYFMRLMWPGGSSVGRVPFLR